MTSEHRMVVVITVMFILACFGGWIGPKLSAWISNQLWRRL